jgi:ubiquinone/menaquinone biosynthesis C-methylase UbiE
MRTEAQIREHYELEVELADRLRRSKKEDRAKLYGEVYNELFSKIEHHPQLTRKISEEESRQNIEQQLRFLKRFLSPETTYLEVGAGDCLLAFEVANNVSESIAVDVSDSITKNAERPSNFRLLLTNGTEIPVEPGSVKVAYSNQLMEHLHEDDAFEQLQNICSSLAKNGKYICVTPNRINGPHDVSVYYDDIARGFHMKEYTWGELSRLFKKAGFDKTAAYIGFGSLFINVPVYLLAGYENILMALPRKFRKLLMKTSLFRGVLFIRLVGIKK